MNRILEIFQKKANKVAAMIAKSISISDSLEPQNAVISISAIPCKVKEDGSFMVLTGTRDRPFGIGLTDHPELVLLYNEKGGIFVETSVVRDIIKEYKHSLRPEIDQTYSIMGVTLNVGVISSWTGEDFLTALHLSSLHDS